MHLALSGLRRGEIGSLRWDHVDLRTPTVAAACNRDKSV
jgi:integrase